MISRAPAKPFKPLWHKALRHIDTETSYRVNASVANPAWIVPGTSPVQDAALSPCP